ncbi:bifunctional riboflavin kinase/FAD synthetase [Thalassorhabdomicrobium marinisediminis]|uniref:Riboflavin biosynthesis protein n=1 Tax=Thalassorhabdomicrobium marinisediminis TaxID=2170577 RepID=A0A2T7FUL0_9RHOB|nr:bifunctional riboflavin kinase/FAD synthetase [Thalassorhabdomicrobium marinisediminis]PVA05846.1 bifunctional riboflavin kinase/FMN adenylyltransferase [Thalassorhabdomicrobium marinisediminis]
MRIIRDPAFIAPADRGAAAAIGNFDGVHLGHQAVLDLTGSVADGAPLGVLTFEPHPREYFAPDAPPFRLMSPTAKAHRLEKLGVQRLYEVPFNAALAALTPWQFAEDIIHDRLGLTHVVVGADFCFGKDRAGNAADLEGFGAKLGFGVTIAPMLQTSAGAVSSTAIRRALSDGAPRRAAEMLGHRHRIDGPVISGEQRGRDLGYPTANMSIDGLHPPKFGVYAVKVDVLDGPHKGAYHGAASIGVRPMFGENVPNCETYLFDFSGDLYGAQLSVGLVDYLRGEETFDSLDALITQMDADCRQARDILADD